MAKKFSTEISSNENNLCITDDNVINEMQMITTEEVVEEVVEEEVDIEVEEEKKNSNDAKASLSPALSSALSLKRESAENKPNALPI